MSAITDKRLDMLDTIFKACRLWKTAMAYRQLTPEEIDDFLYHYVAGLIDFCGVRLVANNLLEGLAELAIVLADQDKNLNIVISECYAGESIYDTYREFVQVKMEAATV